MKNVQGVGTPSGRAAAPAIGVKLACLLAMLVNLTLIRMAESRSVGEPAVWRRGETMEPSSFDPHKVSTVAEGRVLDELYEGLTVYDGEGRLRPGAASGWDVSADALTYTFHLRPEARWSNGDPLTAADFAYSFRRLMDPRTGAKYASILYTVKNVRGVNTGRLPVEALGVAAPDPHTFVITLEHPAAYLPAQLTHFTAMPLHRAEIERYGDGFARPGRMVGNGPFVLADYVPHDRIVMRRNRLFREAGQVRLDAEVFYPLEDASAGLRRFLAGEIDSFPGVPVDEVAFARRRLGADLHVAPSLGSYFYAFDCREPPFDDARVRVALSLVVDRDFLARRLWGGTMQPGFSFVPPGIGGYDPPSTVSWRDDSRFRREDEARRLLGAAGYGPGHPLRLTFRTNQSENHRQTAVAIADMWRVLGVETEFIVTDAVTHYAFLASDRPYDVIRSGWFADFADAENYLFLAESDNRGLNYAHFSDPAYDALMRRAREEGDEGRREAILHEAEELLLKQQPFLVLMSYEATNLVSPRLAGWSENILDHHPGRYISLAP